MLFDFAEDENDENNLSAYTFVSTVMLLVINMFANDLKIPIEYYSKFAASKNMDIYIDLYDEINVYNASAVEMIWPHYQNRYCLIYTNTISVPADAILSYANIFVGLCVPISLLIWLIFYMILYYR